MYVADQSSTSRRRSGIFDKETTPGEFTLNPDPIKIYRRRAVFEPNPSQQGLKLADGLAAKPPAAVSLNPIHHNKD